MKSGITQLIHAATDSRKIHRMKMEKKQNKNHSSEKKIADG